MAAAPLGLRLAIGGVVVVEALRGRGTPVATAEDAVAERKDRIAGLGGVAQIAGGGRDRRHQTEADGGRERRPYAGRGGPQRGDHHHHAEQRRNQETDELGRGREPGHGGAEREPAPGAALPPRHDGAAAPAGRRG